MVDGMGWRWSPPSVDQVVDQFGRAEREIDAGRQALVDQSRALKSGLVKFVERAVERTEADNVYWVFEIVEFYERFIAMGLAELRLGDSRAREASFFLSSMERFNACFEGANSDEALLEGVAKAVAVVREVSGQMTSYRFPMDGERESFWEKGDWKVDFAKMKSVVR